MAGSSMTLSYDDGVDASGRHEGITKVIADWVSDDTTGAVAGTTRKIVGELVKGVTDPGAAAPTDDYDIAITDEEGLDILTPCQSTLANRDTANSEQVYFLVKDAAGTPLAQPVHPVVCDKLTISVSNAGNSKAGQLILYVRQR